MFADPLLRNNLPGLLESVRTDASVRELYLNDFIKPGERMSTPSWTPP